jgi:hypothetical protein
VSIARWKRSKLDHRCRGDRALCRNQTPEPDEKTGCE